MSSNCYVSFLYIKKTLYRYLNNNNSHKALDPLKRTIEDFLLFYTNHVSSFSFSFYLIIPTAQVEGQDLSVFYSSRAFESEANKDPPGIVFSHPLGFFSLLFFFYLSDLRFVNEVWNVLGPCSTAKVVAGHHHAAHPRLAKSTSLSLLLFGIERDTPGTTSRASN